MSEEGELRERGPTLTWAKPAPQIVEPPPMRQKPPDRRHTWRQKVKIGGRTVYADFGEYADGRLCEVFLASGLSDLAFTGGMLGALARVMSLALQHGVPVSEVAGSLRGLKFEPNGEVRGSPVVSQADSIVDWLARELEGGPYARSPAGK